MIGKGLLRVSQPQMVEAVQEWLDKRWTVDPPVIASIKKVEHGYGDGFDIELVSNKEFLCGPVVAS